MKSTLLFVSLLFLNGLLVPQQAMCLSDNEIRARYTLEKLDQATFLLVAAVDGKKTPCSIEFNEAKGMLLPLHSLVDEQVKLEAAKITEKRIRALARKCEKSCNCGIYADLARSRQFTTLQSELEQRTVEGGARIQNKCLQQAKWFCKSPLLNTLLQRWKSDFAGNN